MTLRIRGGDGSLRHLVSSGQRTPSLDPSAAFYVGINIDVTAQVEQQVKLAATESRLVRNAGVIDAGPIQGSDGETIGAVVAWYDITAFRDAEQSERVARLAAETAVRQRETFAATVAHELRTPLSAIAGWTQVLDRNPNPSLLERGVKAISTSVQGMSRILDDFLDLARINAGKFVTTRVRVELAEIVHASVEALQPIAAGARVVVQWSPPAEAVLVLADPQRIQQAVLNLLSNAVKYSTEGGLVLVTLEAVPQHAVLRIADYGQGIDPEDLPHIFDEFYQADRSSARKGGLGLGLTISRHIVRSHQGTISADSRGPGRGATFTIELPRL